MGGLVAQEGGREFRELLKNRENLLEVFKKKQGLSEFCPKGWRGSDGYKPVPHRTGTSDTLSSYFSTISKRLRPAQKYFVPMRPPPSDSRICPFFLKKYDRDNAEERSMGMEGAAWVQIALSVSGPIQSCHRKIRNLLNSVKTLARLSHILFFRHVRFRHRLIRNDPAVPVRVF